MQLEKAAMTPKRTSNTLLSDYFANCGGSCGGDGWSGNLKITYTYDPPPSQVPLPGALPLFATGLGALGLLGWRRKRKNAAVTPAA